MDKRLKAAAQRAGLGLIAATAMSGAIGCASSVGDIDRTQPNLLDKSMFEGEWFVRQTVVDVPVTSAFSFIGETGNMDIIRWEIQQDYIVGYRAYERVPGADPNADHENTDVGNTPVAPGTGEGRNPDEFKDNPVVAFRVLDHVDVQRDYNPRTGEQTNVIVENTTDRPWYERDHIRVDWSENLVHNFEFISTAADIGASLSTYVPEDEGGQDAFRAEKDEATGEVNYIDFTERLFVQPGYECMLNLYQHELGDCTAGEVKVRTSFMKVDEARERDYVATTYDDLRQGEFGYFRTERPTYDRLRGVTYSGLVLLANKHDIWQSAYNEDGTPKPENERGLRPITYTLSPGYPEAMLEVTYQIAGDWDYAVKQAAAATRGQTIEELEADLQAQTGNTCYYCIDENRDGHARIGDLRYNFIAWVDSPQLVSPLGYGPSSAHPETGRIVAGMAYVYGAAVDTYAQQAKDMVDVINGDLLPEDLQNGDFIRNEIANRRPNIDPRDLNALRNVPLDNISETLLGADRMRRIDLALTEGLPQARRGYDTRQLQRVEGTPIETLLVEDELLRGFGHLHGANSFEPGEDLATDILDDVAPASWGTVDAMQHHAQMRQRAEKNCVWLTDFRDPSILGLARELKDSGLTGDELWQELRERIYRGVMLHEIGHTMGLRHNFGASSDALNYFDEFWPLKDLTINTNPANAGELFAMSCSSIEDQDSPGCREQFEGKMREYQYASIMDYGAKFNSDVHGLGRYDMAAIAAAYGELVEVFDPTVTETLDGDFVDTLKSYADARNPLFGSLTEQIHYTQLPTMFGGYENMARRQYMKRSEYLEQGDAAPVRVPYVACYDEYGDATATCHTWDEGADTYEIVMNWVNGYNEYYLFNNFQRDRVGFSPADVLNRVTSRYFLPIANMYQHWIFNYGYGDNITQAFNQYGTIQGFNLLWSVMSTPQYGSYKKNGDRYEWQSYTMGRGDLDVPMGVGRRMYSRYDYESGYFLFDRTVEAGYFYDQLGALIALTSNDASVIGIGSDVAADFLSYSIPYYLAFQGDVDNLFTGMYLEDYDAYAPRVVDGQVQQRSIFNDSTEGDALAVGVPWSTRYRTLLYGMALLSTNFDLSFVQKAQISLAGSGEEITASPGFEAVTLQDPTSPRIYVAYRPEGETGNDWLGAARIEQINAMISDWQAMPNSTDAEKNARESSLARIRNELEDLEIVRGMYQMYGLTY